MTNSTGQRDRKRRPNPTTYPEFLERHAEKIQTDGTCVVWVGALDPRGYGRVAIWIDGKLRTRFSHRVAFALACGEIAPGADVDHICHNPPCLNPDHLRASTHQQNLRNRRGADRGSQSGVRGVRYRADCTNNPWEARVFVDGRQMTLGQFADRDSAEAAVVAARARYYGEYAGGS